MPLLPPPGQITANLTDLIERYADYKDASSLSLPQFTKPFNITSPTFVQSSIFDDPIIPSIYANLYNLYSGYILMAIRLNDSVASGKKIRDVISAVSTEEYEDYEDILKNFKTDIAVETRGDTIIVEPKNVAMPTGRMLEVTLIGNDRKEDVKINLLVLLNTRVVKDSVMDQLVNYKTSGNIQRRWYGYKAGEISFWKDFVFQLDRFKRLEKAMKYDKDHVFRDFISGANKRIPSKLGNIFTDNRKHNILNNIFIFDQAKFRKYVNSAGLKITSYTHRQRLMVSLGTMLIVLVDPLHNCVTIYINGFESPIELSYDQCKDNSKSDKVSITEIMQEMTKGKLPSF